ncbi:MAG: hypothetical protein AMJ69_02605 [Gammaproteobacteria bacterium SG8_47]|nr:MAG: hypothetical protein AMJ69_02605 [Gammaproteobacteria bacterium SG8_47]
MLETDGIPPRLNNQVCEAIICQQYWYRGKLAQEVDALSLKVNGRWHQLYFDAGVVFWRMRSEGPVPAEHKPDDPFDFPLVDLGEQFDIKGCLITDCVTEPVIGGARVSMSFEDKGTLVVTHSDSETRLRFIAA